MYSNVLRYQINMLDRCIPLKAQIWSIQTDFMIIVLTQWLNFYFILGLSHVYESVLKMQSHSNGTKNTHLATFEFFSCGARHTLGKITRF